MLKGSYPGYSVPSGQNDTVGAMKQRIFSSMREVSAEVSSRGQSPAYSFGSKRPVDASVLPYLEAPLDSFSHKEIGVERLFDLSDIDLMNMTVHQQRPHTQTTGVWRAEHREQMASGIGLDGEGPSYRPKLIRTGVKGGLSSKKDQRTLSEDNLLYARETLTRVRDGDMLGCLA